MDNLEKIRKIIPLWYAQKAWAEELLVKAFKLDKAEDILKQENRGNNPRIQLPSATLALSRSF